MTCCAVIGTTVFESADVKRSFGGVKWGPGNLQRTQIRSLGP